MHDPRRFTVMATLVLSLAGPARAQDAEIESIEHYLMDEEYEIALARSAAPAPVSEFATVMVLGSTGYRTAVRGSNKVVCLVIRPFGGPTFIREHFDPAYQVPECFDAEAATVVLPVQLLRAQLAAQGFTPEAIRDNVREAFRSGRLRRTQRVSFSYMLSNAMRYRRDRPGNPHIMVYLPDDYSNEILGAISPSDRVIFVEGGPDEPYTAAVIYRDGLEFVPPAGVRGGDP